MDNIDVAQTFVEQWREIGILKVERDKLRAELINIFRVVESGDWSVGANSENKAGFMSVDYEDCETACDRAEKLIAETVKCTSTNAL